MSGDHRHITRFAGLMTVATALSRVTGLARDMLKAHFFGTGMAADAFTVAFRLPNLLRRLFGEGTLNAAFIPVYTDFRLNVSEKDSWRLVSAVFNLLTIALAVVTLLGMAFAGPLVRLFAPGFVDVPGKFELTVQLTRWLFPYIMFVGLAALAMAVLNTHKRFFLPALAPIMLNVAMIAAMLFVCPFLGDTPTEQIYGLAWGTLIGGVGQFVLQVPALRQIGFDYRPVLDWGHTGVQRIIRLMGPGLFALGITQINIFVDTFLASLLEEGSIAALEYGNRLMQLPLGMFAISISTAILPGLSEKASQDDTAGLKSILGHALRMIFFIMIPASVGLIALREPIIALVFQRGEFNEQSALLTGSALLFYSVGLFAFGGVKAVGQVFFAQQDTKTPVKIGVIAMISNIVLNFALVGPLKLGGLALATSLSSMINLGLLIFILRRRIGRLDGRIIVFGFVKIVIISFVMGYVAFWSVTYFSSWWGFESFLQKLCVTLSGIGAGGMTFIALAKLTRLPELDQVLGLFRRK